MIYKKVYLAGPIQHAPGDHATGWRDNIKKRFRNVLFMPDEIDRTHDYKISFLDPMRRDYRGCEHEPEIYREIITLDKKDIRESDAIIARIDERLSAGTQMEIFYAHSLGKPVLILDCLPTDKNLSPWVRYHSTRVVKGDDPDEMLPIMRKFLG